MTEREACQGCGFEWDAVTWEEISPRIVAASDRFGGLLRGNVEDTVVRPDPDRWSALEYACHVRDALFNLRDRIVLGAVEDNPVPHPMHGTPRIEMGLYRGDDPVVVADELIVAAGLFTRTLDRLPAEVRTRPIFYPYPRPATRDLRWVAAQALHESEHHLGDAQDNLDTLRR
jgi:hypothetical protein